MRLPKSKKLVCHHLGMNKQDLADIEAFEIVHPETGRGLELYLKQQAMLDERSSVMRTYLVRFKPSGELVGYFSLKAGLVSVNEETISGKVTFDTMPGVELANFAINNVFLQKHDAKGLGYLLFSKLIVPFIIARKDAWHLHDIPLCPANPKTYPNIRELWLQAASSKRRRLASPTAEASL